jgi:uncharacterized protein YuzE
MRRLRLESYDDAEALYIEIVDTDKEPKLRKVSKTTEIDEFINVDYDHEGNPLGIEIVGTRKTSSREILKQCRFC